MRRAAEPMAACPSMSPFTTSATRSPSQSTQLGTGRALAVLALLVLSTGAGATPICRWVTRPAEPKWRRWSLKSTGRSPSARIRRSTSFRLSNVRRLSNASPTTTPGRARQRPGHQRIELRAHHVRHGRRPNLARRGQPRSSPTTPAARRGGAFTTRASSASARTGQRAARPSRKALTGATSWPVPSPSADPEVTDLMPATLR